MQLGEQADGLGIVARCHCGARFGNQLAQRERLQCRIRTNALDCWQRLSATTLRGGTIVAHRDPGARIIAHRLVEQTLGIAALVHRTRAQPIPGGTVHHRLTDECRHLESIVRQRHCRRIKIFGL